MQCPFCQSNETKVLETRISEDGAQIRRRRECSACSERYNTLESADLIMPRIIKSDGSRVTFDEQKLRSGLMKALEKRPVQTNDIESAIQRIKHKLTTQRDRELKSQQIGEWVMNELSELDQVAYIRFASVYRHFQDIEAFQAEIEKLIKKN